MKNIILFVWQLPQAILGFFLFLYFLIANKIVKSEEHKIIESCWIEGIYHVPVIGTNFGVSLGVFIFYTIDNPLIMEHELGHVPDSRFFGWLYLVLIGLPGTIWRIIAEIDLRAGRCADWYWNVPSEMRAHTRAGIKPGDISLK